MQKPLDHLRRGDRWLRKGNGSHKGTKGDSAGVSLDCGSEVGAGDGYWMTQNAVSPHSPWINAVSGRPLCLCVRKIPPNHSQTRCSWLGFTEAVAP